MKGIVDESGSPRTMTREAFGRKIGDFPFPADERYLVVRVDGWRPPWSRTGG